ncbi:MAG TPA: hypothetical protein PLF92_12190 [Arenimonas sp.]|nr:hypothetical protein [Arenimonas sp.]HOZ05316.1 hypothetical protein [Arenimonas sp.]HPO24039.1 hypothetical protein [Arenimonas sp.]HPW33660.1 hypothetical protein [Arenimonas sp.]
MTISSFAFTASVLACWYVLADIVPASSTLLRTIVTLIPVIPLVFLFRAAIGLLYNRDGKEAGGERALQDQLAEVQRVASDNVARLLHPGAHAGKHMRPAHRRYMRTFVPAMIGYVLVLFASILLLKKIGSDGSIVLRAMLSLAPVVPIIFVCKALIQFLRDCDELERQIELESIALSCLFTGLIFLCLGFLASAELIYLDGALVAIWVFPALCGLYGVTKCIANWRYR